MTTETLRLLGGLTKGFTNSNAIICSCEKIIENLSEKLNIHANINYKQLYKYPELTCFIGIPNYSYDWKYRKLPKQYQIIMKEITMFDILICICDIEQIGPLLYPMILSAFPYQPILWNTHHTLAAYYQSKFFPPQFFKNCMNYLYQNNKNKLITGLSHLFLSQKIYYRYSGRHISYIPIIELLSNNEVLFNILSPKVCKLALSYCHEDIVVQMLNNFKEVTKLLKCITIITPFLKLELFRNYCNKIKLLPALKNQTISSSYIRLIIEYNIPVNTPEFYDILTSNYISLSFGHVLLRDLINKGFDLRRFTKMVSLTHIRKTFNLNALELRKVVEEYESTIFFLVTYCLRSLNYKDILQYEGNPQLNILHYV